MSPHDRNFRFGHLTRESYASLAFGTTILPLEHPPNEDCEVLAAKSRETLVLYRKRAFAEEDSGRRVLWRAFDRAV